MWIPSRLQRGGRRAGPSFRARCRDHPDGGGPCRRAAATQVAPATIRTMALGTAAGPIEFLREGRDVDDRSHHEVSGDRQQSEPLLAGVGISHHPHDRSPSSRAILLSGEGIRSRASAGSRRWRGRKAGTTTYARPVTRNTTDAKARSPLIFTAASCQVPDSGEPTLRSPTTPAARLGVTGHPCGIHRVDRAAAGRRRHRASEDHAARSAGRG